MTHEKLTLIKILSGINKFNESVSENFDISGPIILSLGYCFKSDTLHSFYSEKTCYNCSGAENGNIKLSEFELEAFKKHFGKIEFVHKLIYLIDTWPKKNNFPYKCNIGIRSLKEHENLLDLYSLWDKLTEGDKIDGVLDTDSIQKKYNNTGEKSDELSKLLG